MRKKWPALQKLQKRQKLPNRQGYLLPPTENRAANNLQQKIGAQMNRIQPLQIDRPPTQQNGRERIEDIQEEEPCAQVLQGDEIERDEVLQEDLPGNHQENQQLIRKGLKGENAERWVEETYQEIVKWDPFNLFTPPICAATKDLITEMTTTTSTPSSPH